jgi:hypothetical protein
MRWPIAFENHYRYRLSGGGSNTTTTQRAERACAKHPAARIVPISHKTQRLAKVRNRTHEQGQQMKNATLKNRSKLPSHRRRGQSEEQEALIKAAHTCGFLKCVWVYVVARGCGSSGYPGPMRLGAPQHTRGGADLRMGPSPSS